MIDSDRDEITTTKGCFNCDSFKKCPYIVVERVNKRDFNEIMIWKDGYTEFRYGCSCTKYHGVPQKEKIQFS